MILQNNMKKNRAQSDMIMEHEGTIIKVNRFIFKFHVDYK